MAPESPLAALMPRLPALVVVTDAEGRLRALTGECADTLGFDVGALDDIGALFTRAAAIFLETHLWPTLRRSGRIDEVYVSLAAPGGGRWPCLLSVRRDDDGPQGRLVWLFFPAGERDRFEAELIAARSSAQRMAEALEAANRRLQAQADAERERNRELDALAQTDPLTGLGNRRALQSAFEDGLRRGELDAAPEPGALLMVDADHFKSVNDRWGHDVGDEVLVRFAAKLRASIRRSDCVVRLGGEEFAVWLPCAGEEVAGRVAQGIHERSTRLRPAPDAEPITVSIGIALLSDQADRTDLALLLKRADGALYAAKSGGRNRTCRAGPGSA